MYLNFKKGLIPAIIQDYKSNEVLMLGYINRQALQKTKETGWVYFWSRTKNELWMKGEESGNKLKVKKIFLDCDEDTLLIKVDVIGESVCHTGDRTCFSEEVI